MNRWIATFLTILAALLILALLGYSCGKWESVDQIPFFLAAAETRPELCMDHESRERVRVLMLEALDQAFKQKIQDLYGVWLRDATGQPQRATTGAENALRAYFQARNGAMKFNPPECTG